MKNKIIFTVAVITLSLFLSCQKKEMTGDASESMESIRMNLAMDSPEDAVTYLYSKKFAELVEEKSGGNILIKLYPSAQLGGDREITEGVQSGTIDLGAQTTAPQVNFIPKLALFDMPMLFRNIEEARKVINDPEFYSYLESVYNEKGFKLLGMADQGFRVLTTNRNVVVPSDLDGLKIRTMENPYHLNFWKAVGANPTPMAISELYVALQQGTVDAQENPYEVTAGFKLYEQQAFIENTNHFVHTLTIIMNPARFDALTPEQQKIFEEAADEATQYAWMQTDQRLSERAKIMTDSGSVIEELPEEVRKFMDERAEETYAFVRENIGDEPVDMVLKSVEAVRNE